ncbi:hypothetical protein E3N88_28013 [Mikania micrantha]|uniref:Uncharacterized protein n=1 Tax=Mikania micrantha TaxID=192012 RepID=A0A5N6N1A6_9ASTR|nr:hypothetical protein E3N88_28013 [Mikania micrantha]
MGKFKRGQTIVRKRENDDERIKSIEIGLLGSPGAHRGTRWPNKRPIHDTRPTSHGLTPEIRRAYSLSSFCSTEHATLRLFSSSSLQNSLKPPLETILEAWGWRLKLANYIEAQRIVITLPLLRVLAVQETHKLFIIISVLLGALEGSLYTSCGLKPPLHTHARLYTHMQAPIVHMHEFLFWV